MVAVPIIPLYPAAGAYYYRFRFMFAQWDSWFGLKENNGKSFWYKNMAYSGGEVNYIVAGYAFRSLDYTWEQAVRLIRTFKRLAYWRTPSVGTIIWAGKGYDIK